MGKSNIPLFASEEFKGKSNAGIYGDTVEEIDWSTGEIIKALKSTGTFNNTLILFTSDNGPFFEGSTAGLKGGKGTSWEGGYRVPFIISWPDFIRTNNISDALASNIDILPTVAQAIDVISNADVLDGKSLIPVLRGADRSAHDYLYYFNNERVVGVRSKDWKYVTHAYYTGSLGNFEKFDQLPGFDASYDLLLDANSIDGESYSYADRYPEILQQHKSALQHARQEFDRLRTHNLEKTYPE